jgi:hypothetical protein
MDVMFIEERGMKKSYLFVLAFSLLLLLPALSPAQAKSNLSGQVGLGYTFLDDSGKKTTTEEVYNIYSGFIVENLNLQGLFRGNSAFELDLSNVNKDNRSFYFSLRKAGRFSLNSRCNQSRFLYDENGYFKSIRTISSVWGDYQITPFFKLKADYYHHLKKYYNQNSSAGSEEEEEENKQFFQSGGVGILLKSGKRYLDVEYRLRSFDSEIKNLFDRNGSRIKAVLNTPLQQNVYLSLSYLHDNNKLKNPDLSLTTNLYQGTAFYQPVKKVNLTAKFSFQRTDDRSTSVTSDIIRGGGEVSYKFQPGYDVNLGYQYERRKEQEAVGINSYLAGLYFQPIPELSLKARYLFEKRKDPEEVTLTGPWDNEKVLVEMKSRPVKEIDFKLRYEDRTRKNPDISTSTSDRGYISFASFSPKNWLDLQLTYYLLKADYTNTIGKFRVDNHTLTSLLTLKPWTRLTLSGGWNHIDLRKDLDIRKEGVVAGFDYSLWNNFSLQGKYELYTYDDYIQYLDYYGTNVYRISLTQKF